MIKIVLPDHPDKHTVKSRVVKGLLDFADENFTSDAITDGQFSTEITHNGSRDRNCWDIDVIFGLGLFSVRSKVLSREGVDNIDMLQELMLVDNGSADEWIRALLGDAEAEDAWRIYRRGND